ncbi:leucyl aminopeptidase [Candidatus Gottesmanbacteria bacterium]|nr:leucyl aminopeptidase [Candidatus Gottesmanbacteria bacterium]
MKFQSSVSDYRTSSGDMLVVFAANDKEQYVLSGEGKAVDELLSGVLSELLSGERYDGAFDSTYLIHTHGKIGYKAVLVTGLGDVKKLTVGKVQKVCARIARRATSARAFSLHVALTSDLTSVIPAELLGQSVSEGILLGSYVFLKHKEEKVRIKHHDISECIIHIAGGKLDAFDKGLKRGEIVAGAVSFVRDLVNEPPSTTTPAYLGDRAKSLAKKDPSLSATVFDKKGITTLGMGALLGIARGSEEDPRFIHLSYKATGAKKTVVIVGKGITFDTGGLSLKPANGMETMKLDMAGAGAVLGVFSVLPLLKPHVNVVGLISATENMPSGSAIKPGDIVTAMNGKTIEVLNTDAEGRVVLADALSYACKNTKPDYIIDLATLTGACMVALGEEVSGMFTNDTQLGQNLKSAADNSGEAIWELPLVEEYEEELKSNVADIKNVGSTRYGGAINGALFLKEFVDDGISWAHLDIAGPSFSEKDTPLVPKGASGVGVRLLLEFLKSESVSHE